MTREVTVGSQRRRPDPLDSESHVTWFDWGATGGKYYAKQWSAREMQRMLFHGEVPKRPGKPPLEDEKAFGTPYEQVHQAAELQARKHAGRSLMW